MIERRILMPVWGTVALLVLTALIVVASTVAFHSDPAATGLDQKAIDLSDWLRSGWLDAVSKVITTLGSTAVLLPLIAVVLVLLFAGGHRAEAVVLLLAALAILNGVDWLKDYVARPRPVPMYAAAEGWSFPSGHAAHSTFYAWIALAAVWWLKPGMRHGGLVIAAGFALSILIGLSRVYLNVHYVTDVIAGWAFGGFFFAFFTAAVVLAAGLRKN